MGAMQQMLVAAIAMVIAVDAHGNHGGIVMGIPLEWCDDGVNNIAVDWDGKDTEPYTCKGSPISDDHDSHTPPRYIDEQNPKTPLHLCLNRTITYNTIPLSGSHRPLWARYGEYTYLPPQRWVHNLEHAAVVFVYHPCADPAEVEKFREVVKGCLRKHIITPSKLLSREQPFGLITWGHGVFLHHFEEDIVLQFIERRAMQAHEWAVLTDGQYGLALKTPAEVVGGDRTDTFVCKAYKESKAAGN